MVFQESSFIDLTSIPKVFIYFLTNTENTVIYIGKTTKGLSRVYAHFRDKQFENIYIIKCTEDELDRLENYYIKKYTPTYNKKLNATVDIPIQKAKKLFNLTKPKLNELLRHLNITPLLFNNSLYIDEANFQKLTSYIKQNGGQVYD